MILTDAWQISTIAVNQGDTHTEALSFQLRTKLREDGKLGKIVVI